MGVRFDCQGTAQGGVGKWGSRVLTVVVIVKRFCAFANIYRTAGFPGGSAGKESICNVGDLGSIPGLGRSSGEGNSYPLQYSSLALSKKKRKKISLCKYFLNFHKYQLNKVITRKRTSLSSCENTTRWICTKSKHSINFKILIVLASLRI